MIWMLIVWYIRMLKKNKNQVDLFPVFRYYKKRNISLNVEIVKFEITQLLNRVALTRSTNQSNPSQLAFNSPEELEKFSILSIPYFDYNDSFFMKIHARRVSLIA